MTDDTTNHYTNATAVDETNLSNLLESLSTTNAQLGQDTQSIDEMESIPFILSFAGLTRLSKQVYEELLNRFGMPAVAKFSSKYIVIGTRISYIMVFDLNQRIVGILDPPLSKTF